MLCLSDPLSLSFKLQELSRPTSSQDCSTGEQIPGDLWSSPSLERSEIVLLKLEKALKCPSAALPVLAAALGSVPHPARAGPWCTWPGTLRGGTAWACRVAPCVWGATAPFWHCLEAGSVAVPVSADLSGSVGTACGSTAPGWALCMVRRSGTQIRRVVPPQICET